MSLFFLNCFSPSLPMILLILCLYKFSCTVSIIKYIYIYIYIRESILATMLWVFLLTHNLGSLQ